MNASGGLFVSFEGTEGSGKTTQMRLLVERLRAEGLAVVENQEPGATRIGGQIRRVLLDPAHEEMEAMTELLLMFAVRAQAAAQIIVPALERGETVISDRFTDSSLAYQGEARGLGFGPVLALHRLALGSLFPDLTICLMLDVQTGLERVHRRNLASRSEANEARLDRQPADFYRRVEEGYRKLAALEPARFRIIDASGDASGVAARVWAEVSRVLARRAAGQ
jgi:dTMP kinase